MFDCRYEYIGVFDIDEVIVPRNGPTFQAMMAEVTKTTGSLDHWMFRNTYFFHDDPSNASDEDLLSENIPEHYHMLRHIYRSALHTKGSHKSVLNPQKVLKIRSHSARKCDGKCTSYKVDPSVGQLQHYRQDCTQKLMSVCQEEYRDNTVRDTSLWVIKDTVLQRVEETLNKLGYF